MTTATVHQLFPTTDYIARHRPQAEDVCAAIKLAIGHAAAYYGVDDPIHDRLVAVVGKDSRVTQIRTPGERGRVDRIDCADGSWVAYTSLSGWVPQTWTARQEADYQAWRVATGL